MSDQFISFNPDQKDLAGILRIFVAEKTFMKASAEIPNMDKQLQILSEKKVLQMLKNHDDIHIYCKPLIYICSLQEDDENEYYNLSVKYIGIISSIQFRAFIQRGIFFTAENGVEVVLQKPDRPRIFFDFDQYERKGWYQDLKKAGAESIDYNPNYPRIIPAVNKMALKCLKEAFSEIPEEEETEKEDYVPGEGLEQLLDKAENYSILTGQAEEQKMLSNKNAFYTDLEAKPQEHDRISVRMKLEKTENLSIAEKGMVSIKNNNGKEYSGEITKVYRDSENSPPSGIEVLFTKILSTRELPASGQIEFSYSSVVRDVQLNAIDNIRKGKAPAKYMDHVLGEFKPKELKRIYPPGLDKQLEKEKYPPNESQLKAIRDGILSKDAYLVMGPPGTGKTTVIVQWVRWFANRGKRVLISSKNNKAVDNVLAKFVEEEKNENSSVDMLRIGSETKVESEIIPYIFENKVRSMESDILASCDRHIQAVREEEAYFSSLIPAVRDLGKQASRFSGLSDQLFSYITKNVYTAYKSAAETANKYIGAMQNVHRLNSLYLEAEARKAYLQNQYDGKITDPDHKAQYESMLSEYDRQMANRAAEIRRSLGEAGILFSRYEQDYKKYQDIRRKAYEDKWLPYMQQFRTLKQDRQKITAKSAYLDKTFSEALDENNYSSFPLLAGRLDNDLDRLQKLRTVIEDFKAETESQINYAVGDIALESVNVVGATCIGINSQKRFAGLNFDVTIIDEAGQIQIQDALVPMSVSNKLIMLGDHKQIPPSADKDVIDLIELNNVDPDLYRISLFERMYEQFPDHAKVMLDTQYRIPGEIADTISDWFYDGKYRSFENKRGIKGVVTRISEKPYVIIDISKAKNHKEKKTEEKGTYNTCEAGIAASIAEYALSSGLLSEKDIGIISAYKAQVKKIQEELKNVISDELKNEVVATLDSFQGQERDLIIYSFTRSSDARPDEPRIGFLNELRRLNVAMSRGKKQLILIGDIPYLSGCRMLRKNDDDELVYEGSERQFADFIRKVVHDVKEHGEYLSYAEFEKRMEGCHGKQ